MDGTRFDRVVKGLATSADRRRVVGGLAAGLAGAVLGRTPAAAAPSRCNAAGSVLFPPGPGRATFVQVCKKCDSDVTRVCETAPGSFTCCPEGQACFFSCATDQPECCEESVACPGTCAGTCCQEP
jgi:hypothetical protein